MLVTPHFQLQGRRTSLKCDQLITTFFDHRWAINELGYINYILELQLFLTINELEINWDISILNIGIKTFFLPSMG
jgi:hypothetical protein